MFRPSSSAIKISAGNLVGDRTDAGISHRGWADRAWQTKQLSEAGRHRFPLHLAVPHHQQPLDLMARPAVQTRFTLLSHYNGSAFGLSTMRCSNMRSDCLGPRASRLMSSAFMMSRAMHTSEQGVRSPATGGRGPEPGRLVARLLLYLNSVVAAEFAPRMRVWYSTLARL